MRILLVNPLVALNRTELGFPLTLIYLGSALKSCPEFKVELLDLTLERFLRKLENTDLLEAQKKILADCFEASGPFDLVGITGLCDNFHFTLRLAEFVKRNFGVPVVLGGPHATFISNSILSEFPLIDYVIKHEGAKSLVKLCEVISSNGNFAAVPGLVYRKGGEILSADVPRHHGEIDTIVPRYDLLPVPSYLEVNVNLAMPVLVGAGCPFSCSYCSTSLMWHRKYTMLPVERIGRTIANLKKAYGILRFTLIHDNLLFRRDKTLELAERLKRFSIKWSCSSRIEHIRGDKELVSLLSDSGCTGVFIGLETASSRIQKSIGKNVDAFSAPTVLKDLIAHGIKPTFSFILGFPDENDSDKNETIKLAFQLKARGAERININHLSPLPGTRIVEEKLRFFRAKREFSVSGLLDQGHIRFVERHKSIFISHWFVTGCRSNSRYRPSISKRLHEYCAVHYRSFNYLFSEAGMRPSDLFDTIRRGVNYRGLFRAVREAADGAHYLAFREMYKYERGLKRLVDRHPSRKREVSDVPQLDLMARYSLSDRVELIRATAAVYEFMTAGRKQGEPDGRRLFLCLVDTGPRIETYKISPVCFDVYKTLIGNSGKSLGAIISRQESGRQIELISALHKMNSIGGLIRDPS